MNKSTITKVKKASDVIKQAIESLNNISNMHGVEVEFPVGTKVWTVRDDIRWTDSMEEEYKKNDDIEHYAANFFQCREVFAVVIGKTKAMYTSYRFDRTTSDELTIRYLTGSLTDIGRLSVATNTVVYEAKDLFTTREQVMEIVLDTLMVSKEQYQIRKKAEKQQKKKELKRQLKELG